MPEKLHIEISAPNGDVYSASRDHVTSPWTVLHPYGQFRKYGTQKQIIAEITKRIGLSGKPEYQCDASNSTPKEFPEDSP